MTKGALLGRRSVWKAQDRALGIDLSKPRRPARLRDLQALPEIHIGIHSGDRRTSWIEMQFWFNRMVRTPDRGEGLLLASAACEHCIVAEEKWIISRKGSKFLRKGTNRFLYGPRPRWSPEKKKLSERERRIDPMALWPSTLAERPVFPLKKEWAGRVFLYEHGFVQVASQVLRRINPRLGVHSRTPGKRPPYLRG